MTPAAQKRLFGAAALAAIAGILGFIAYGGIEESLVYYWSVEELLARGDQADGATIRLGGMVQKGTWRWQPATLELSFTMGMTPAGGPGVEVTATGAPPQMLREGIGAVVEGTYDGRVFRADRIIVKHSNEYRPPEHGEQARDVYKSLLLEPER